MLLNQIVKISSVILRLRAWAFCLKEDLKSGPKSPYTVTPTGTHLHSRVRIVDDTFGNRWALNQTTSIQKKKQAQSGISHILLIQHKTQFSLA